MNQPPLVQPPGTEAWPLPCWPLHLLKETYAFTAPTHSLHSKRINKLSEGAESKYKLFFFFVIDFAAATCLSNARHVFIFVRLSVSPSQGLAQGWGTLQRPWTGAQLD